MFKKMICFLVLIATLSCIIPLPANAGWYGRWGFYHPTPDDYVTYEYQVQGPLVIQAPRTEVIIGRPEYYGPTWTRTRTYYYQY